MLWSSRKNAELMVPLATNVKDRFGALHPKVKAMTMTMENMRAEKRAPRHVLKETIEEFWRWSAAADVVVGRCEEPKD